MSHSPTIPERRWDYGMVGDDLIAIPICEEQSSEGLTVSAHWTRGILATETSYWNEKEWVKWRPVGAVNYFSVQAFRNVEPDKRPRKKGAGDGSETVLIWSSCFSPCDGTVADISAANITVLDSNGKRVRRGRTALRALVSVGDSVLKNQMLACNVVPRLDEGLKCDGGLSSKRIAEMLGSQHLPVRYAGVKLARARFDRTLRDEIAAIARNQDEDIYVRLEAKVYLASIEVDSVDELFSVDLNALDKADQLEAVIAIGEVGSESSAVVLAAILGDQSKDYFLRSAAAYCLGRIDSATARDALVNAFTSQTHRLREDALTALASVGYGAIAELLRGVNHSDAEIQAGCVEVLRWMTFRSDPDDLRQRLVPAVSEILSKPDRSLMAVWLGGQLPESLMRAALTEVLGHDARLAYSLAVSWAFARSWIAPIHDAFHPPKL